MAIYRCDTVLPTNRQNASTLTLLNLLLRKKSVIIQVLYAMYL